MASALGTLIAGTAGCVACWDFEEAAGATTAVDEKGASPGSYIGAARCGVQGANGKGFLSLIAGDAVSVPHTASLNVADVFTIVAVHRRSLVHSANAYTFYSKGSNSINFG